MKMAVIVSLVPAEDAAAAVTAFPAGAIHAHTEVDDRDLRLLNADAFTERITMPATAAVLDRWRAKCLPS